MLLGGLTASAPLTAEPPAAEEIRAGVQAVQAEREALDRTVWAGEIAAQRHEEVFIRLWDLLRKRHDRAALLADFPFETLVIGVAGDPEPLEGGVRRIRCGPTGRTLTPEDWRKALAAWEAEGWRLDESEWHHSRFEQEPGRPARSTVGFVLHVSRPDPPERVIVRGDLQVEWASVGATSGREQIPLPRQDALPPVPRRLDASDLMVLKRTGRVPFEPYGTVVPAGMFQLLVFDLDGDGLSEVVLCGKNRVLWNRGGGRFDAAPLCEHPAQVVEGAVLADFTGDAIVDYLCAPRGGHPQLFVGEAGGRFPSPGRTVPLDGAPLELPLVITAGDIDGDGDLDAWVSQYEQPMVGGQMPTPYYDANDGFPSYLLVNDGQGRFEDRTEAAGLAPKRFRRTYSASFVDLDDDGDQDLLVVADFAGVDVHLNDGSGRFSDATDRILRGGRHLFGMGHAFADFDLDGRLDVYAIGMSSTTARRLDRMGLGRAEFPEHQRMRSLMGYGNRMYLARDGGFVQAPFNDAVARTGWSWGATALDIENDGDPDLYVANGHRSMDTARDYCTRYWTHDIYTGSSKPDPVLAALFRLDYRGRNEDGVSWNGFEHNVLYMNRGGTSFVNVGYLMGVGLELDCRNVVSDDLDGDGRMDLLVTGDLLKAPRHVFSLHMFRNRWDGGGHWIGFRFREHGPGYSPVGTRVTLRLPEGTERVARIVTGDSFRSQHASTVHFGLGDVAEVAWVEARWPNGAIRRIHGPVVDRYHALDPEK